MHTTQFLLNVARDPDWLGWLNERKHLDALFSVADLGPRDILLAGWLAQNFAIEHPDAVFKLVAAQGLRLSRELWFSIARELANLKKPLEVAAVKRWTTIMLASAPPSVAGNYLMSLARRCEDKRLIDLVLQVFMSMTQNRLSVRPTLLPGDDGKECRLEVENPLHGDHWPLDHVWTKYLKPNLAQIAQPLLSGIARRLEEIHDTLSAWDQASSERDPVSYGRSAIEQHEQNKSRAAINILIDASRDALEWLSENSPALLAAWIERLVTSHVPLLRRLAIHAVTTQSEESPDKQLKWLLDRVGLHRTSEHHEIYRAVALNYPVATDPVRKTIVDAILKQEKPATAETSAECRTAWSHFNWLSCLLQAKPDCPFACEALVPIKAKYPDWRPMEHPDLRFWSGPLRSVTLESPWSIEQLLTRDLREQLDNLLNFVGNRFDGPSRDGLLVNIREASKQNSSWALALAQALATKTLWSSDLWPALILGLQESELTQSEWHELLLLSSNSELQAEQADDIANLLETLVKDGGKSFALDLLRQANAVSVSTWRTLQPDPKDKDIDDLLSRAVRRAFGVIVEFWFHGLYLLMQGKSGPERTIPDDYRQWFTMVLEDPTTKGGSGRVLLASRTAFLFDLSEEWTREHIIPLFSEPDRQKFTEAWSGFLTWGHLSPPLVESMIPLFLEALPRLATDLRSVRQHFIELYTKIAIFDVPNPSDHWLPELFHHASTDERIMFASQLGNYLRQMQEDARQRLWDTWLHKYWKDRMQGVPKALDEAEIQTMMEWLPHLGEAFPAASELATHLPPTQLQFSQAVFELGESDLIIRFPEETAKLLIYFASCGDSGSHLLYLKEINDRLPVISVELRSRLDEALAYAGISPRN